MKAPDFWFRPPHQPGLRARLLTPLSLVAGAAARMRSRSSEGYKSSRPVICVGNINIGGTGKTPTVMALAEWLTQRGHHPAIVTRGYGGTLNGPVVVKLNQHSAADVGDEALLLAEFATVIKSVDRAAGVKMAEAEHDVILMDDGHQNPSVMKDFSLVVVNARQGFGNGRLFPAGPLREAVDDGLSRADGLLCIGEERDRDAFRELWSIDVALFGATLRPLLTGMPWNGLKVFAFAGIAAPERFFETLRAVGADVIGTVPLDDHQPLSRALMTRLAEQAKAANAQLVTTEKDAVRLPMDFRAKVLPFPVRLDIRDRDQLEERLKAALPELLA